MHSGVGLARSQAPAEMISSLLYRAAKAARDVPAGESWAFVEHRMMAEVIAEETAAP
jgi:hypothetical protein